MGRARSFEGPALVLGRTLHERGHHDLAAALLEIVPETGAVKEDAQRALLVERLRKVADDPDIASQLRAKAAHLADVASADPTPRGRIGTVWIAWSDLTADGPMGADVPGLRGYWVSWQSDRGDDDWYEDGPSCTDLRDALTWARERTDAVIVRPEWDEGTHYWAGSGHDPRNLPPLDESRA